MALRREKLPCYAAYLASRDGRRAGDVLAELEHEIADGRLCLREVFATLDLSGQRVTGAVRLVRVAEGMAILTEWRGDDGAATAEALLGLLAEGTARAVELGLAEVTTRIDAAAMTPAYAHALRGVGFRLAGRRVEYKTPVSELPREPLARPPLTWRTMAAAGEPLVRRLLREASVDTPDAVTVADGPGRLVDLLGADYPTLDPRTAQVGSLDGRPVAVLVVRVEPASGWSTLPFIGVVPEARGKGLGRHVHLRGLQTIRALGGTLYHDGTDVANAAMVRLFERHGCVEHGRMEAWRWPA